MKGTFPVGVVALALGWTALGATLLAQTTPPVLVVQGQKGAEPLGLRKLETEVRIHGSLAETTTTMTFFNPLSRAMEGDLYFPLPEGATVSGYALDVQGKMVDGVAVEKHKGRQVFEEVVRRGVDPGLVEWTKGNNFHTRVFPIPARGTRTVRVQYVAELVGGKEGPAFHLPLNFKEKIAEFSLRVEVVKPAALPRITQGELANFTFARWRESFVAETKLADVTLAKDLIVALPAVGGRQVQVEKAEDGQVYFAVTDVPPEPRARPAAAPPRHVVIYWDASGSRGRVDHERELGVLRAYFDAQQFPASGPARTIDVDLILFRNVAAGPKRIVLTGSYSARLIEELKRVQYDGGTQMAAISPRPGAPRPDFYMLFSDGLSNFGAEEPRGLDAPVYVFSADPAANHPFLHQLAMSTGGRYFNLAQLPDAQVVPAIGRPAFSFLSALSDAQAAAIYPELPRPVAGRFTLAGKLAGQEATITLSYGVRGEAPERHAVGVSRSQAVEGSLLRRLWAEKKLADLMIFPDRNEKQILALGKEFGMVTPFTSLIVLETLDQYVQYEIAPPKSLAAMREEYLRRVDTLDHQKKKVRADKLDEVVKMWQGRVQWWETQSKYPAGFKYRKSAAKKSSQANGSDRSFNLPVPQKKGDGMGGMGGGGSGGGMAGKSLPEADRRPAARAAPGKWVDVPRFAPFEANLSLVIDPSRSSGVSDGGRRPGIAIKPWDPATPYLKELRAAKEKDRLAVYFKNRARFGQSPAFFLDCADFFFEAKDRDLALQVLSNLAELQLEDPAILRILGYRLRDAGYLDLAIGTFDEVLRLRPEEPQSYRDLALTLARRAEENAKRAPPKPAPSARDDYGRAIELLTEVVLRRWDGRFPEIEVIALEELNQVLPRAKAAGVTKIALDPRLIKLLDVDVRIVMTWHADATDIDLWVTEPSGEKAYYQHDRTTIGGLVSRDFTGGYGPEEYLLRKAMHGTYRIEANYYGSRATRLLGPVTVEVDVFTHYGRPNQQRKSLSLRLKEAKETFKVGEIEF